MSDATITAIFATIASAILGWLAGYMMGRHDGRAQSRSLIFRSPWILSYGSLFFHLDISN